VSGKQLSSCFSFSPNLLYLIDSADVQVRDDRDTWRFNIPWRMVKGTLHAPHHREGDENAIRSKYEVACVKVTPEAAIFPQMELMSVFVRPDGSIEDRWPKRRPKKP
jgi:hypothetical protein